ncbi:hypothetical protein LDENG_00051480 [Lucifuga dentata]|nr:hypothetical protein LDENG_00051480 [Lucifuga dentata]
MMTILAFALDRHLRTRFNVLIINLAVADLLYCTILQPISVDSYLHLRWRSGELWCSTFGLLLFLSNSVSIITLCLIAVSRYLLIQKKAVFDRVFSDYGLILLLISAWALGLASFGPLWPVYVFVPQGTEDSGVQSGMANTCSCEVSSQGEPTPIKGESTWENPHEESQPSQATQVSDKASHSSQPKETPRVPSSNTPAPTTAASSSHSTASGDDGEFKRVTRMCLTVFLCFVFCFVPFLLLNIADKHNRAPHVLHMFCANLTWLNSCINPMLYAVMNRQFRQAYHVLLRKAATPFICLWTMDTLLGKGNKV